MQVRIGDPDLGAQLEGRATDVAAILQRKRSPGAALAEEDRARASRNRARLEERYSYPVIARSLAELLREAVASARF